MPPITTLKVVLEPTTSGPSTQREKRRAYISPDVLRTHKLAAGSWVVVSDSGLGRCAVLQLWPRASADLEMIHVMHERNELENGSNVDLHIFDPSSSPRGILRTTTLDVGDGKKRERSKREQEWLRSSLKEELATVKYVTRGYTIRLKSENGDEVFKVSGVEPSTKAQAKGVTTLTESLAGLAIGPKDGFEIYEMDWRTKVIIGDETDEKLAQKDRTSSTGLSTGGKDKDTSGVPSYINLYTPGTAFPSSTYARLGGLKTQIALVRSLLELPLTHPESFALFNMSPPKGILLHGPPGTGKTALARAVASSTPGCSCIVINGPELSSPFHGETEERLRGVFEEAAKRSPCVVVLDEVDALCPRRDGDGGEVEKRVVATLLTLMDGIGAGAGQGEGEGSKRVFVIGATNRPNSVDPALRRPGRFDREIEIGIPDANGRREIIEIMLSTMPHSLTSTDVDRLADRTHGFVGADLVSLIRESCSSAIQRHHSPSSSSHPNPIYTPSAGPVLAITDVIAILPSIRPSTMREVFIETPSVKWSDIGGQSDIKRKLKECVEWPLTHRDTFKRLGVEAPRGVLLYGPPGCSKTMTAKALATESGLNFIAVKGPELLNKFVGESERAVREIFRKARAASPSIIFFDEIDALGSSRSDGDSPHNGVLTSLLNEMDGIEELANVTVVAATNRPDVLDSALMRPGRLDRILYVGAPDLAARRDIFRIKLATMAIEPSFDLEALAQITEGCSGAEIISICQDAALEAMNEDLEAPFVKGSHLRKSAETVRRRITPEMIDFFESWRDQSGVRSA